MCGTQIHQGQSFKRRSMKPGPITWSIIFWRRLTWLWRRNLHRIQMVKLTRVKMVEVVAEDFLGNVALGHLPLSGNPFANGLIFFANSNVSTFMNSLCHSGFIPHLAKQKKIIQINLTLYHKSDYHLTRVIHSDTTRSPIFIHAGPKLVASPNGSELFLKEGRA